MFDLDRAFIGAVPVEALAGKPECKVKLAISAVERLRPR